MRRILALCCAAALPLSVDAALRGTSSAAASSGLTVSTGEPNIADSMAAAMDATHHMVEPPAPPAPVVPQEDNIADGTPRFAAVKDTKAPKWLEKPPYWLPTPPEWGPPPAHIFSSFYAPNTIPQPVFRPSPFSYDSTNFRAPPPWTSPAITTSAMPGGVVGIPATSRFTGYMNIPSPGALSVGSALMTAQHQQQPGPQGMPSTGIDPMSIYSPWAAYTRGNGPAFAPAPGAVAPPAPMGGFPLPAAYMYTQASGALAPPPAPNVFLETDSLSNVYASQSTGSAADEQQRLGTHLTAEERNALHQQQEAAAEAAEAASVRSLFPSQSLPSGSGAMGMAALKKAMALHAALASDSAERRRTAEAAVRQHARDELATASAKQ